MSLARRLLSQSTIIFGGRLFGAGLIFLVQAFIARFWGAAILGEYLIIMAVVNLVSTVMPLGFQTVSTYFAAEYRARGDRRQFTAFLMRSYAHVALMFVILCLAGPLALELFGLGGSSLAQHFMPVALLGLAAAVVYVSGNVLIGIKRPYAGLFADGVFRPMMMMTLFFACALTIAEPQQSFGTMLWAVAFGYLAIAVGHFTILMLSLSRVEDTAPARPAEVSRWWRFATPWVLITIATDYFFDIDLLLLATILEPEELAIFGVCTRIFALVSFGVSAVYFVTFPDMFESEAKADRQAFHRKVGEANLAASVVSIGLFIIVAAGAPFALSIFGPSFTSGAVPMAILCLALVVRALLGPASMVLSIHDRPWSSLPAVALGMVTLVIGNWLLVPSLHLTGAALAALIAITVWSIGLWLIALRLAKIDVSILQWLRSRRAAVPAE
ncbi:lipopolysaccharide biosynthesis protein [Devosia rhizoryzae]|uniref:Lipopolysaccharide biosynthesis protein n=1 Tax=Devosia rhizoryzae TaxID=2774137 RepID=A0ABX7CE80_9HYPH|nr:lipopolysaccharide biosynthesis protein [Devosia rhizoryzae]QQR40241.1 lipopolysaccharide biosynthesis protein [Devosia rhizoryzae]